MYKLVKLRSFIYLYTVHLFIKSNKYDLSVLNTEIILISRKSYIRFSVIQLSKSNIILVLAQFCEEAICRHHQDPAATFLLQQSHGPLRGNHLTTEAVFYS